MINSDFVISSIVKCIRNFKGFSFLFRDIKQEFESLLLELCDEQVFMYIKPDEVKQRKKQRKIENELSDLQIKLAASSNSSRNIVLSNREIRLLRFVSIFIHFEYR